MGVKLNESRLDEGIRLLAKLSAYLEEYGKDTAANWFRRCTDELKKNPPRKELYEVCSNIMEALGAGSGRITDIYFAHPDGKPDVERTADYLETIQAVRRFARRSAPPWSYFLW